MLELSGLTGKTLPFKYQQHPITFPHFYHNLQPLGTNTEREIETQGMARALMDFDSQMGVGPEEADKLLSWVCRDGASHATTLRLQKHLCSIPDNHQSFQNRVSTPEIWHAKATMINSISANHYGPGTSKDPSSLSRSSNVAGNLSSIKDKTRDGKYDDRGRYLWVSDLRSIWRMDSPKLSKCFCAASLSLFFSLSFFGVAGNR
jgi:hypothetical protein